MFNKNFFKQKKIFFFSGEYCPGTFDGWLCWPDTDAGTFASAPCPAFVTGFDPNRKTFIFFAKKRCF